MTANTSTHDHTFYRDTFSRQLRSWRIPFAQVIGVTTDGDAAVVKVGRLLSDLIILVSLYAGVQAGRQRTGQPVLAAMCNTFDVESVEK